MTTLDEICATVAKHLSTTIDIIKLKSRKRESVYPRQMCCKVMYDEGYTVERIGQYFGIHYTSVISSKKTISELMDYAGNVRAEYYKIINEINEKQ